MYIRENFVLFSVPLLLTFILNGEKLELNIINFSEVLAHEFGHLIQKYSPANIDYNSWKYSASDISNAYSSGGFFTNTEYNTWVDEESYNSAFNEYLNFYKQCNNKYRSLL